MARLPEYVVSRGYQDDSGYETMRQLLQLNPHPDGVFCYNDPVAAGAIKAVCEAGLNVPKERTSRLLALVTPTILTFCASLCQPLTRVARSSETRRQNCS
jgi:LacI family transcriptional regulator